MKLFVRLRKYRNFLKYIIIVAFVLDCHDREAISWIASSKGVDGEMIRDLMVSCIDSRFGQVPALPHKLQWLSDNGPAYVARKTLRTYFRF